MKKFNIKEWQDKYLNEASESELKDIHNPSTYWKDFRKLLANELKKYKMEARISSYDGKPGGVVQLPFFSNTSGVSTRIVYTRAHGTAEENELMSKTGILFGVDTAERSVKVIEGDKVSLDGVMSINMVVERNHSSHTFYVRDSQLTWFHPFKKNVFKMSLGGGVTDDLLDYIVREIKFAVKKRGNRIRGAAYKVV
jgi:hypothetical protein